ncbi:ATP-binding cassette domain-containing protein [Methanosarcina sp. T3]|uniref:ATP-binding cassette domain-containing protein n=1 Tax=Methanosarcina sp. T3 TaxID=3439062 RepID=UPI003F849075
MNDQLLTSSIKDILNFHPFIMDFFASIGLKELPRSLTLHDWLAGLTDEFLRDSGMDRKRILNHIEEIIQINAIPEKQHQVSSLTVIGGKDKYGNPENASITLKPGEVVCIVGPTGSGKSRLLADIECMAQKDTPTGRQILINGCVPEAQKRFSMNQKIVAQLSQNMNFVVDLTVKEFITMHAECRMISRKDETINDIIYMANELTGEKFSADVSITQLSGGQTRSLMIADTALLSASPIVLIDEIENAGVNRKKALELLVDKEKIVLVSTHDPLLALMGDRRIVIRNGAISNIIETSKQERMNLEYMEFLDCKMTELRDMLRNGGRIDTELNWCSG